MAEALAQLTLSGLGVNKQVEQMAQRYDLTLTRTKLGLIRKHPRYKEVMEREAASIIENNLLEGRLAGSNLLTEVVEAIKKGLKKGDPRFVIAAMKLSGIDIQQEQTKQDQSITVVMPGAIPVDNTIEVKKVK